MKYVAMYSGCSFGNKKLILYFCNQMLQLLLFHCFSVRLLFEGSVCFFGNFMDINEGRLRYVWAI